MYIELSGLRAQSRYQIHPWGALLGLLQGCYANQENGNSTTSDHLFLELKFQYLSILSSSGLLLVWLFSVPPPPPPPPPLHLPYLSIHYRLHYSVFGGGACWVYSCFRNPPTARVKDGCSCQKKFKVGGVSLWQQHTITTDAKCTSVVVHC